MIGGGEWVCQRYSMNVQQLARARGSDDAVNQPEYLDHHRLPVGRRRPVLRVCRVVDNPVEIEVERVELDAVGIGKVAPLGRLVRPLHIVRDAARPAVVHVTIKCGHAHAAWSIPEFEAAVRRYPSDLCTPSSRTNVCMYVN